MEQTTIWDEAFAEAVEVTESAPEIVEPEFPTPDLLGLLELGKLSDTVNVGERTIVLRTLTIGEELEVGLLIKEFQGTSSDLQAYVTATVAAAIVSIDGRPLVTPLGPNENTLRMKFDHLRQNFYWPVINLLYKRQSELVDRAEQALLEFEQKKD